MVTYLFYHVFGLGKLPAGEQQSLQEEGIRISHEGLSGSLTYTNYRAPGKVFLGRKRWFVGALAVSNRRLVAYAFSRRVISLPLESSERSKWKISVEDGNRFCLGVDASDLAPDQSGGLTFRFTIPDAEEVAGLLARGGN